MDAGFHRKVFAACVRACGRACLQTGMDTHRGPAEKAQAGGACLSALSPFPLTFWKPKQGQTDYRSRQVLWYMFLTVSRQQGPCFFKRCLHFWLGMSDVWGRQRGAWDTEPPNYLCSTHGSQVTQSRGFLWIRAGQMLAFKISHSAKAGKEMPTCLFLYCLIDLYFLFMVLGTEHWALYMLGK